MKSIALPSSLRFLILAPRGDHTAVVSADSAGAKTTPRRPHNAGGSAHAANTSSSRSRPASSTPPGASRAALQGRLHVREGQQGDPS